MISHSPTKNKNKTFNALSAHDPAPSENITFTNCVGWGGKARCYGIITYNAAMRNKISAANETNTMNVTVENCNFRKLNSAKNRKLMFETDEFANVTYK